SAFRSGPAGRYVAAIPRSLPLSSVSRRSNGRASTEIWEPGVASVYARIFAARTAPAAFAGRTAARYACPACCFVIVSAGVVCDATVVVCEMFFAGAVWVAFVADPPQPTSASDTAVAPIPITLLTRFIAVSMTPSLLKRADEAPVRGPAG